MIVTLDAFSGRPNPSWRLSEKDNSQLMQRLSGRVPASAAETGSESALGYRGFIITAGSDDELPTDAPHTFRLGGAATPSQAPGSESAALSAAASTEVSRFLLNTGRHVLEADLMTFLESSIQGEVQSSQASEPLWIQPADPAEEEHSQGEQPGAEAPVPESGPLPPCLIANTPYHPAFWNTPAVQPKNNCYNFAMNWRSDTFAQPGRISGHMYTAINCANVGAAANWDGCHTYCSGSNKNVALVIAPGPGFVDFHWYRRQKEGFWAHKPGGTAVRNVDNSGRLIDGVRLTPANCNRGPYTIFCGYRFSPTGMRVS